MDKEKEESEIDEAKQSKNIYHNKTLLKLIKPLLEDINFSDKKTMKLRERQKVNYCLDDLNEDDIEITDKQNKKKNKESYSNEEFTTEKEKKTVRLKKIRKKICKKIKYSKSHYTHRKSSFSFKSLDKEYSDDYIEIIKNEDSKQKTLSVIKEAESLIKRLEREYIQSELEDSTQKSIYPEFCIPINADVLSFDFEALAQKQLQLTNKLFDAIMMDPPWKLSSSNPTRGVAIAYDTLQDNSISNLPIEKLQRDGFIFIWTINAKMHFALELIKKWGYKFCDEIVWVKQTVHGKIAKGHGYYLQHTKETCLVGIKGNPKYVKSDDNYDIIFSQRRGQSQKPTEIYDRIEKLIPNGHYLELFGRRNNLRDYWVTIGNEI